MKNAALSMIALGGLVATACGGSFQAPSERLASSEAAIRSARLAVLITRERAAKTEAQKSRETLDAKKAGK